MITIMKTATEYNDDDDDDDNDVDNVMTVTATADDDDGDDDDDGMMMMTIPADDDDVSDALILSPPYVLKDAWARFQACLTNFPSIVILGNDSKHCFM